MRRARLARLFWIGAAVVLAAAALVAVVAVLSGNFSSTDGKILTTLGSLLLAGATAVTGLSLVERRQLVPLGWAAVVGAVAGFVVLEIALWGETAGRLAGTAVVVLTGLLLATTGRILLRERRLLPLYGAMLGLLSIAVLLTVVSIWGHPGSGMAKAIATFWILAVLAWFLVPVLQRFSSASAERDEVRVLGELDGVEIVASRRPVEGVRVDAPSPGERLFLRRHEPASGRRH